MISKVAFDFLRVEDAKGSTAVTRRDTSLSKLQAFLDIFHGDVILDKTFKSELMDVRSLASAVHTDDDSGMRQAETAKKALLVKGHTFHKSIQLFGTGMYLAKIVGERVASYEKDKMYANNVDDVLATLKKLKDVNVNACMFGKIVALPQACEWIQVKKDLDDIAANASSFFSEEAPS